MRRVLNKIIQGDEIESRWNKRTNRKITTSNRFRRKDRNDEDGWHGSTSIQNEEKLR